MKYDPERHHRRSIRLPAYDYSSPGAYFVTICVQEREMALQDENLARLVQALWLALPERFANVQVDEFVVMPNHVHGIIWIVSEDGMSTVKLSDVVLAFKSITAIGGNRLLGRSGRPFWQRNYFERVVRNDDELERIRQYIRDNPLKWDEDPNNPDRT